MSLPQTVYSKVVPTEYDVERRGHLVVLSDDRSRPFVANVLLGGERRAFDRAYAAAERAQDPSDPIHHFPFPSPSEVPAP